jgi:hypothetical protein
VPLIFGTDAVMVPVVISGVLTLVVEVGVEPAAVPTTVTDSSAPRSASSGV